MKKLADHFLCIRQKIRPGLPLTETIKRQYQEYAEQGKIDLSEEIAAKKINGTFSPRTCKIEFESKGRDGIPDGVCRPPNYDLTLCEY